MFLFRNKTWLYLLSVTLALKMKTTSQDRCFPFPHPLTVFYRQGAKHSLSHSPQRCPCPSTLLTWFRMWTQCSSYYRSTKAVLHLLKFLKEGAIAHSSQWREKGFLPSDPQRTSPVSWPWEASFQERLWFRCSDFLLDIFTDMNKQPNSVAGAIMACIIITRWH